MKKFITSTIITAAICTVIYKIQTYQQQLQRRQIFNGKNFNGWQHVGDGKFIIENGLLKTAGGMGLLWYTQEKFGNCIIRVVYKTTHEDSNSGIFVRIAEPPKDPWQAVHHGYEIQIYNAGDETHCTGAVYSLSTVTKYAAKPAGEWNVMEITLNGTLISVTLNGIHLSDFDDSQDMSPRQKDSDPERGQRPAYGYIGLQNHDHDAKENASHVYFKEISVWPL